MQVWPLFANTNQWPASDSCVVRLRQSRVPLRHAIPLTDLKTCVGLVSLSRPANADPASSSAEDRIRNESMFVKMVRIRWFCERPQAVW